MTPWEIMLAQFQASPKAVYKRSRSKGYAVRTVAVGITTYGDGEYKAIGCIYNEPRVIYRGTSLDEAIKAKREFDFWKKEVMRENKLERVDDENKLSRSISC
jgi:hypothetical protein